MSRIEIVMSGEGTKIFKNGVDVTPSWEEEKLKLQQDFYRAIDNGDYTRVVSIARKWGEVILRPNTYWGSISDRIHDYLEARENLALACGIDIDHFDKFEDREGRSEKHYLEMEYPSYTDWKRIKEN